MGSFGAGLLLVVVEGTGLTGGIDLTTTGFDVILGGTATDGLLMTGGT